MKLTVFYVGSASAPGMGSFLRSKRYGVVRKHNADFSVYFRAKELSANARVGLIEAFSGFTVRGTETRTQYKARNFFGVFQVSISAQSAEVEIAHGAAVPVNGDDRGVLYGQAMTLLCSTGWPSKKADFVSPFLGQPFMPRNEPDPARLKAAQMCAKKLPAMNRSHALPT